MPSHSTLARLQQVLTLWILACAIAWLVLWWRHSAVVAVLGFLAATLGFSAVLAIEFGLMRRIARDDPAPRATRLEVLGAWLAESGHCLQVFCWRQPFDWRAVPDQLTGPGVAGRTGVVLVHGFVCNRGFWTPWLRRLNDEGRCFVAVNLEPVFTSIDDYAPLVDAAVERVRQATGRPPVLVCHSMGGVVARAWMRTRRDEDAVARVVTIGSPHAGTWLARFSHMTNARQMHTDSAWTRALQQAWNPRQAARFTCWYSNCDNIVMPPSTATLPGADNRLVLGAAHVALAFRPEVMAGTWALLDAAL